MAPDRLVDLLALLSVLSLLAVCPPSPFPECLERECDVRNGIVAKRPFHLVVSNLIESKPSSNVLPSFIRTWVVFVRLWMKLVVAWWENEGTADVGSGKRDEPYPYCPCDFRI